MSEVLLQKLLDQQTSRELLERDTYAPDGKNRDCFEELFWPDAVIDFGAWPGDLKAYMPWVTELENSRRRGFRQCGLPRLQLEAGSGHAEVGASIAYAHRGWNNSGRRRPGFRTLHV